MPRVLIVGNSYCYYNNLTHVLLGLKADGDSGLAVAKKQKLDSESPPAAKAKNRILTLVEPGKGLLEHVEEFRDLLPAWDPDVVVLQDQSLTPSAGSPAHAERKGRTIEALREVYRPALAKWYEGGAAAGEGAAHSSSSKQVLLVATWARADGMFDENGAIPSSEGGREKIAFVGERALTDALEAGCRDYADVLVGGGPPASLPASCVAIAPVGRVVLGLREKMESELGGIGGTGSLDNSDPLQPMHDRFRCDDSHPSPLATFALGLVLARIIHSGPGSSSGADPGGADEACGGLATIREPRYGHLFPFWKASPERDEFIRELELARTFVNEFPLTNVYAAGSS